MLANVASSSVILLSLVMTGEIVVNYIVRAHRWSAVPRVCRRTLRLIIYRRWMGGRSSNFLSSEMPRFCAVYRIGDGVAHGCQLELLRTRDLALGWQIADGEALDERGRMC